jgi:phospholipase C
MKYSAPFPSILCRLLALAVLGHTCLSQASAAPDQLIRPEPVADSTGKQERIVVMTYNIQQLGYSDWMANHFETQRLALIPRAILSHDQRPDILIMQEVFTEHSFEYLVTAFAHYYPYHTEVVAESCISGNWTSVAGNCRQDSLKGNGGVLILSRWPMKEKHAYVYHGGRVSSTFDFMAQKGAVYARIEVGHGERNTLVHVLGTHLQADGGSHDIRMQQIEEMRLWIDQFNIEKAEAVILGGDFNVSSHDTAKLADLLNRTNTALTLPTRDLGSVSPGTNQYLNLISAGKTDKTVDYILYRKDHLIPKNRPVLQVINLKSDTPWKGRRVFGADIEMNDLSDHYPTLMVFEF